MAFEPFMKWGFDFMRPVNPTTSYIGNQYIIVTINYTIKWVEVKSLRDNMTKNTIKFIYEQIITHFNCSTHLVND
jgi:hypothetical protein